MAVKRGDRIEYVGEAFWVGDGPDDWIRSGQTGVVVDLEPPDDAPIISWDDDLGGCVVRQEDVRAIDEPQ